MKRPSGVFYACLLGLLYMSGLLLASIWILCLSTLVAYLFRRFVFEGYLQLPVPETGAILITGTSTGIGKELAFHFVKKNLMVFATVRKIEDAERLQKECPENKHLLKTVIMDTTHDDQVKDAVETIRQELKQHNKQLYAVICNAGVAETYPAETTSKKDYDKMFGTNVYGTLVTIREFTPLLREYTGPGGARILITTSLAGILSAQGLGLYCASKHALEAICDTLQIELRFWNIKVSVLQPGTFDSPMITDIRSEETKFQPEQYNPMIKNFKAAFGNMLRFCGMKDLTPLISATEKVLLAKYPPIRRSIGLDVDAMYLLNCMPDSIVKLAYVFLETTAKYI